MKKLLLARLGAAVILCSPAGREQLLDVREGRIQPREIDPVTEAVAQLERS